jgi:hypothetical protein
LKSRRRKPSGVSGTMNDRAGVRWRHDAVRAQRPDDAALDWIRENRIRTRGKRNKPLRCRPLEGRRDQKSPFVVASSYVPRGERGSPVFPPAAGCCRVRCRHPDRRLGAPARPASILKPWRLSGLLSGCPPTDTRPQARAKLGKAQIRTLVPSDKYFFDTVPNIGRKRAAIRVCELWRGWTRIVHAAVSCVPPIQSRPAIGHRA